MPTTKVIVPGILAYATDVVKGDTVLSRPTAGEAQRAGTVFAFSPCQMHGCASLRAWVRWPDGHVTKPCGGGMRLVSARRADQPGVFEII